MKTFCALATLAAATAVENTAPVISLSLDSASVTEDTNADGTTNALDHNRCNAALAHRNSVAADPSKCVEYDTHVAEAVKDEYESNVKTAHKTYATSHPHSFAAKGLVTADAAKFPEPTASAYDHHDESHVEIIKTYTYFVISRPACNTFSLDSQSLGPPSSFKTANHALSAGTATNDGNYKTSTGLVDEVQCAMQQTATNVDLVRDDDGTAGTLIEGDADLDNSEPGDDNHIFFSQAMRDRRGEFIIKYDATDRAGNQASQLVFAMILVDDECPCIVSYGNVAGAIETIQAMDSCMSMAHKEGGKVGGTYASCATLDRSKIMLNEKKVLWKDNYDGISPTMASANGVVRTHGLKYSVTHEGGKILTSSVGDAEQAVYVMVGATAVTTDGAATIEYTTKDYANIFGYGYEDNKCVSGVHTNKETADATQTHCAALAGGTPAYTWTIKDDLPPRIFPNPNLLADGDDVGTEAGSCGKIILDSDKDPRDITYVGTTTTYAVAANDVIFTPLTNDAGRKACHAWNIRRRWCATADDATDYDNSNKCVGWSATTGHLFAAGTGATCTKEAAKAFHECGEAYKEPGYVCVDMRDSFSATSTGEYLMTIAGVNSGLDATKKCLEYHVNADATCMHHTKGKTAIDNSDKITYSLSNGDAAGPAITLASKARFGKVFELTTANTASGYPLYGKDNFCETDFTATYTCTDALDQTVNITRTIQIKDTVNPILEIATAGMSNVNKLEGEAYGLALVYNNDFDDNTNMDHGVHVGGRTNTGEAGDQTYINAKGTTTFGDWHGDHDNAISRKGMNSHYHDGTEAGSSTTAKFLQDISGGSVGSAILNYGGKTWKVDQGVLALRNQTDGEVTVVGIAAGVQDSYTIQHSSGFDADEAVITNLVKAHKGFACYDACDGDLTHAKNSTINAGNKQGTVRNGVTMTWHHTDCESGNILTTGFNTLVPGTYALKYVCEDECGNSATKCRTILNEDHTKPVITVLEADDQTYEATREDNYVDAGATCSDEVDGNISQDVEVSGDVVNLARVGVYTIKYNCQDSASNEADEATRKVTVQDTSCPTCVLSVDGTSATTHVHQGDHIVSIEASFPYSDVGAVAQDTLQGSFGICSVWSDGDMKASYKEIVNVEATGTYFITYRVKDSNGNWNDGSSCSEGQTDGTPNARENIRTVVIIDTLRPVIELKYKGTSSTVDGVVTQASEQVIHRSAQEFPAGYHIMRGTGGNASDPAETSWVATHVGAVHDGDLENRQWAETDHSAADNHRHQDGSFMAEEPATTAVNGWVIGAVASAVSGLALLGYSLRKSAAPVATSVPV